MSSIFGKEVVLSDNVAIRDDREREMTYRELHYESEKISKIMKERSLVFVICDNSIETLGFVYQVILQNRIPLLLSKDISQEFLEKYIDIFHPAYLYCSNSNVIVKKYERLMEMESHVLLSTKEEKVEIHPDVALLLCTSGTTGSSKLVKLSYENLYTNAEEVDSFLNIRVGQVGLTPLPINYTYGFSFCLWHWYCGATVLTTEYLPISKEFSEIFEREKVNYFAAVPFTYQMLNKVGFWNDKKKENLCWAASGGARMSEMEQQRMISILKNKFWILYGQTECTCIISGTNFKEDNSKIGTVGRSIENIQVCTDDETEELIVKGKNVCMGYASSIEELKTGDVNNGIWHTGDVVYIDEDGYIYLKGRIARFIKVLGNRISLDEIEKYLKNKYDKIEFACTGIDDNIKIYHTADIAINNEIIVLLKEVFKIPVKFISCFNVLEIPRNESGKIQYTRLRGM